MAGQPAFKRVEPPPGYVHVLRGRRSIKLRKLSPQSRRMGRLDSSLVAVNEKHLQPFVGETANHRPVYSVAAQPTRDWLNAIDKRAARAARSLTRAKPALDRLIAAHADPFVRGARPSDSIC